MDKHETTQSATQKTEKGLKIPIPTKRDVFGDLAKTARPKSEQKARKPRRRLTGSDRPSNKKR